MNIDNNVLAKIGNEDIKNGKVIIPKGVTSIENYTFCDCTSLTSIVIPKGVTRIGNYAFKNCISLKTKKGNYKAVRLNGYKLFAIYNFEYKSNEWTPVLDDIKVCKYGYHYCKNFLDIFNCFNGEIDKDIAIFECEVGDEILSCIEDSKKCTNTIKLTKRLYKNDIIQILNKSSMI